MTGGPVTQPMRKTPYWRGAPQILQVRDDAANASGARDRVFLVKARGLGATGTRVIRVDVQRQAAARANVTDMTTADDNAR